MEQRQRRERRTKFLTIACCLGVIIFLWINDILSYTSMPLPSNLSRYEANVMILIILFFITILALFPAFIYVAFEIEGRDHARNRTLSQLKRENLEQLETAVEESFDAAQEPISYRLPLVLLTVAMMLGWAFFFFSCGPEPVWQLASERNLSEFFVNLRSWHPIVFGFLGSYFFTLQVLIRRYFNTDIKPSVFMHFAARVWLVMLLSLILSVIWQAVPVPDVSVSAGINNSSVSQNATLAFSPILLAICFLAGIMPNVALDLIMKTAKAVTGKLSFAIDTDPPITKIQGLNLWHQVRLAEEGIDNIQNLAQCPIVDLIVYTRFGVRRLLDWIDQALLFIHTGDDFSRYQGAGIHTASEFVKVYEGRFKSKKSGRGGQQSLPPTARMFNQHIAICDDVNFQRLILIQNDVKKGRY